MILSAHIFLSIIILGLSAYFKIKRPENINGLFGYRSSFSMKNRETWKEGNKFSSDLQVKFALLFIAFEAISYFIIGGLNSFYLSCGFLTIISIAVIPLTEHHLRKNFDKEGRRYENDK